MKLECKNGVWRNPDPHIVSRPKSIWSGDALWFDDEPAVEGNDIREQLNSLTAVSMTAFLEKA